MALLNCHVNIEVEFSHLKNTPATQGRLTLLDTPGPNEAGQKHLRHMLKDQLKKASAVLAVLDYTQLKSDADAQVRENLLEISGTAKGRMYALVNKFDQKDRNSDDATTVKQYVAQTLMKGELEITSVFPVSANQGYLASRARNEVERNGSLNPQESWTQDFGEKAFGFTWEDFIQDPSSVKRSADRIWQKSGFAEPLNQVIVEAYQNAALEALRSAASKLEKIAKDTGDFFKANVGALKKDAAALQKNIDDLQGDIENITRIERTTSQTLKAALKNTRGKITSSTEKTRAEFEILLKKYFDEGKSIEFNNQSKRSSKRGGQKTSEPKPLSNETEPESTGLLNVILGKKRKIIARDNAELDFSPTSSIIKFDSKSEANKFLEKIEKSIRHAMKNAESDIKDCIQSGINEFSADLDRQRKTTLEELCQSVQNNIDGLEISVRLPNTNLIVLDNSISSILEDAVEEKKKSVTRSRRKSGVWGTVCGWFNTDDWGWEDYTTTEEYYQVDLRKISKSSSEGINSLFESANAALQNDIHPQLQDGVDEFFGVFREKIEHIRGDLLSGIEKHNLDRDKKAAILENSKQLAKEASGLEKDCEALNTSAETLRREGGGAPELGEALT